MKTLLLFIGTVLLSAFGNIAMAQFDIGVSDISMSKYYSSSEEYIVVSGKIKNYGAPTVNSCKVLYQVNDGNIFEYSVSGAILTQNAERAFDHPEPLMPTVGSHIIKVWTSQPNGQDDAVASNDTMTFDFTVYDENSFVTRTILIEGFTSSTCGPCVAGNANLKSQLEKNTGSYALIKYQANWPGNGDPYYTTEVGTRSSFYAVSSVPWCQIEGTWNGNSGSVTQTILTNAQSIPAFMDIQVDFYVDGQTVYAKANVDSKIDLQQQNLKLYMAIVEKITHNNSQTYPNQSNGETEFQQVMKKFMPDANGIALGNLKAGIPFISVQEWEFKGEYRKPNNAYSPINHNTEHSVENFDNLTIVAWVQNTQGQKTVHQATNGVDTEQPTVEFRSLNNYGTISATVNGEPVVSGESVSLNDRCVFTAVPQEGYEVEAWTVNGGTVQGNSNASIEVTAAGFVDASVKFKSTSNISKQSAPEVKIYPNPVADMLTVENAGSIRTITVINTLGQVVLNETMNGTSTNTVSVRNMESGIYVVVLESYDGQKITKKIVKK